MKKYLVGLLCPLVVFLCAMPCFAHFQMVYSPQMALKKGGVLPLKLVFTHPYEAGHTMDMEKPEAFFVIHKGRRTDVLSSLEPITWTSLVNDAQGWETSYRLRGMGDWIFCLQPAPYLEASEDAYIQQMTKTIFNVGSLPTDWSREVGMAAEIVPLHMPYNLLTGNVFCGIVKSEGKPVPFAEIEVEYINHTPDMKANAFAKEANAKTPATFSWPTTIRANANGEFFYGLPHAGWWGFCALGVGPETSYKDKDLSQDAVIWVEVVDMVNAK